MEVSDASLRYRYPGVKPFTTAERTQFFGRDKDIKELFNLIFVKQAVVLYGKSGYGKSSLINAGIIPKLKKETQFTYFPIRFNNYSVKEQANTISPTETVWRRLNTDLQTESFSPLDALIEQENSFWYWLKTYQWQQKKTQFIFFFDQFEELFTYPKDQINEFSNQLAQLLYVDIPLSFRQRMIDLDDTDGLSDELEDFMYQKPDIKVVFSVRSDRLSLLNGLTDRHPVILQNCYELDALDRSQAVAAIAEPARISQDTGYISPTFDYAPDAITAILDNIANQQDSKIESATLQIVCQYIENKLVDQQPSMVISRDQLGNITDIFQHYYEDTLDRLPESDRAKAQQLIEEELIDNGRRNPLSESYILHKFGISADLLAQLEKTSLLRKERDANGRLLYEVGHDTLVAAIERVASSRRTLEAEVRQNRLRLQEEDRRKELEQKIKQEQGRALEFQKLTEQAQASEQKAIARSRTAIRLAIMAFLTTIATGYFYWKSETATREANQATQQAEEAAKEALMSLNKENYQRAVNEHNTALRLMADKHYTIALRFLLKADSILVTNQSKQGVSTDSTFKGIRIELPPHFQELKKLIAHQIQECHQRTNSSSKAQ